MTKASTEGRIEDFRFLHGFGCYVDDVALPGTLHAVFVRSQQAHARIVGVDLEAARRFPGVVAAYSGEELQEHLPPLPVAPVVPGMRIPLRHLPAVDEVNFAGEAVAVVVAETRRQAEDAAASVELELEPLPVVMQASAGLASDAPLVHSQFDSNLAFLWTLKQGQAPTASTVVVETTLVNDRVSPLPLEPRGVLARFDRGTGELTVWASHQRPHLLKTQLALALGLAEHRVRVIVNDVGGAFGGKVNIYGEEALLGWLSRSLGGRPVKWTETRNEAFVSSNHGRGQEARLRLGLDGEGRILSLEVRLVVDTGAYHQFLSAALPGLTGMMMSGPYRIPSIDIEIRAAFTNKVPIDAYRGAGKPEATFYLERLMDIAGRRMGIEPEEIRRRNFIPAEAFPCPVVTGLFYDSGNYQAALEKALAKADYPELRRQQRQRRQEGSGPLLGIGLACYVEAAGVGPSAFIAGGGWETATVRFERTGKVIVLSGLCPQGQGMQTVMTDLVAEHFGLQRADVNVSFGDTAMVAHGTGTFGSRGAAVGASSVKLACQKLMAKASIIAAALLGAQGADEIEFREGAFYWGEAVLPLSAVVAAAFEAKGLPAGCEPGLEAHCVYDPSNFTFPFGCHLAVVEIDRDTGFWEVVRYVAVDDCGPLLNPTLVEGQVHGGVAQGMGQARCEGIRYGDDGALLTRTLGSYPVMRAADLCRIETYHTVTPSPVNPLGVKGIGEAGAVAAPPAVVNALVDALAHRGVEDLRMPVRPEEIWRRLR